MDRTAALKTVFEERGEYGNRTHITREDQGTIPTELIANMPGAMGEVPGDHRNMDGERWEAFKADIAANGIQNPIFIIVDPGERPKISEGNHRRDAAVELGLPEVPVQIRYFGHSELRTTLGRVAAVPDELLKTPTDVETRANRAWLGPRGEWDVVPDGVHHFDHADGDDAWIRLGVVPGSQMYVEWWEPATDAQIRALSELLRATTPQRLFFDCADMDLDPIDNPAPKDFQIMRSPPTHEARTAAVDHKWWVDPTGEVYDAGLDHGRWMKKTYGVTRRDAMEAGWVRAYVWPGSIGGGTEFGVDVSDTYTPNPGQLQAIQGLMDQYPHDVKFIAWGVDVFTDDPRFGRNKIPADWTAVFSGERVAAADFDPLQPRKWWIGPKGEVWEVEDPTKRDHSEDVKHLDPKFNDRHDASAAGWARAYYWPKGNPWASDWAHRYNGELAVDSAERLTDAQVRVMMKFWDNLQPEYGVVEVFRAGAEKYTDRIAWGRALRGQEKVAAQNWFRWWLSPDGELKPLEEFERKHNWPNDHVDVIDQLQPGWEKFEDAFSGGWVRVYVYRMPTSVELGIHCTSINQAQYDTLVELARAQKTTGTILQFGDKVVQGPAACFRFLRERMHLQMARVASVPLWMHDEQSDDFYRRGNINKAWLKPDGEWVKVDVEHRITRDPVEAFLDGWIRIGYTPGGDIYLEWHEAATVQQLDELEQLVEEADAKWLVFESIWGGAVPDLDIQSFITTKVPYFRPVEVKDPTVYDLSALLRPSWETLNPKGRKALNRGAPEVMGWVQVLEAAKPNYPHLRWDADKQSWVVVIQGEDVTDMESVQQAAEYVRHHSHTAADLNEQIRDNDAAWDAMDGAERARVKQEWADRGWKVCEHPDDPPWNCRTKDEDANRRQREYDDEMAQRVEPQRMPSRWESLFGEDWDVPQEFLNMPGMVDLSDRNHAAPSFGWVLTDPDDGRGWDWTAVRIWVDHPDPDSREHGQDDRFAVSVETEDENIKGALQKANIEELTEQGFYYETDSIKEAIDKAQELKAKVEQLDL